MAKKTTQEAVADVLESVKVKEPSDKKFPEGVSTGSTLLNLACHGRADIGFKTGKIYTLVGDSSSGKTALSMSFFAEAAKNPAFDNYRLVVNDTESGNSFDLERLFGKKLASRVESANGYDDYGNFVGSKTIEEFYFNIHRLGKEGKPFFYVLDSQDSLSSSAEGDKFETNMELFDKGAAMKGSYGDGKPKLHSANLRQIVPILVETGSILLMVSQTRDDPVMGLKTHSGGKSLKFYSTLQIWTSVKTKIKKMVQGVDLEVGLISRVQVKKNRQTGLNREVNIPIYPSIGIDDIGSCIQYLLDVKHWSPGTKIKAEELGLECSLANMIKQIDEDPEKYSKLISIVETCWNDIEQRAALVRRPRYE